MLGILCVLLGLCVLCALCALYAFSKPYVHTVGHKSAPPARNVQMVDKGICTRTTTFQYQQDT